MKNMIPIILLVTLTSGLYAQQSSIGFILGGLNYQGDLVKNTIDSKEINVGFGVYYQRPVKTKLDFRAGISVGKLSGDDKNYPERLKRGISFTTPVTNIEANLIWSPLAKPLYNDKNTFVSQVNPYVGVGMGLTLTNPKVTGLPTSSADKTNTSKTHFAVPIRLGLRFDRNEKWSVGAEFATYPPFTDYLDGVSKSGNPNKKDWFVFYGLNVQYRLGNSQTK
jgi:OmpA-OmpF porin, OOP family